MNTVKYAIISLIISLIAFLPITANAEMDKNDKIEITNVSVENNSIKIDTNVTVIEKDMTVKMMTYIMPEDRPTSQYAIVAKLSDRFTGGTTQPISVVIDESSLLANKKYNDLKSGFYLVTCILGYSNSQYDYYTDLKPISTNKKMYFLFHNGTVSVSESILYPPQPPRLEYKKRQLG